MQLVFKILNRLKRVKPSLFLLTFFILATVFAGVAYAQNKITPTLGDIQKGYSNSTGTNKQSFDAQSITGTIGWLVTTGVGCLDPSCPDWAKKQAIIPKMSELAGVTYSTPPASAVYYALDVSKHLNIVQPAYAQTPAGVGFNSMQPFLNIWRAVRNMTYLLFVLGIVALGFMIMFRQRISPQAVMTVQAALPRMIIALIFITFSYAIVGFVLDLIYVIFGILVFGLETAGVIPAPRFILGVQLGQHPDAMEIYNEFVNSNIGTTYGFITSNGIQGAWDIISSNNAAVSLSIITGLAGIAFTILAIVTSPAAGLTMLGTAATLMPFLLGLIFAVIFFLFRVLLTLARAYLNLILFTIFAPIIILFAAISGRGIWNGWLKTVVANALVFLGVGLVILVANLVKWQIDAAGANIWGPPYLGSGQGGLLNGMVALAAIMVIPNLPDIINQLLNIRALNLQLPQGERVFQQASGSIETLVRRRYGK